MRGHNATICSAMFVALALPAITCGQMTARVGDVTRLQGQGDNVLVGFGLVTGLNGTGDSDKYRTTALALAAAAERMGAPVLTDASGSQNVAAVIVEAIIPDHGIREGDRIDVNVTSFGDASDLSGGRLLTTPLEYQDQNVKGLFAFAQGAVTVPEDAPTSGRVAKGARMERSVFMNVLATGSELKEAGLRSTWIQGGQKYITLVLDDPHAGWVMASAVAEKVNQEFRAFGFDDVALAIDQKNVLVLVPEFQRENVAAWVRDVEKVPLDIESNEARVVINRRTGTIVVTGDTRITPVIVSQKGLTITVAAPQGEQAVPQRAFDQWNFVPLDVEGQRRPNVKDLLEALNRLKVPFEDRVAILEQIYKSGNLHADILYEG